MLLPGILVALVCCFSTTLYGFDCARTLEILNSPKVRPTLELLKIFRDQKTTHSDSLQRALRQAAIDSKANEIKEKLKEEHQIDVSIEELLSFLDTLEASPENHELKTVGPHVPELPNELLEQTSGSFHNRHHPDYLDAKIPKSKRLFLKGPELIFNSSFESSPAWSTDGLLALTTRDGTVHAFKTNREKKTLERVAVYQLEGEIDSSPSWGPGGLLAVASSSTGRVHILKPNLEKNTFDEVANIPTGFKVNATPAWSSQGTLAVGSVGRILILKPNSDAGTIEILSTYEPPFKITSSPVWGPGGLLAFGNWNNVQILQFNPLTHKMINSITFETGGKIESTPSWGPDGLLAVGSGDNRVYVLKLGKDSLEQVMSFKTGGQIRSSPAWRPDGVLAVGSTDNYVYALKPNPKNKTLEELASFEGKHDLWWRGFHSSPAWGPDGLLAVGSERGNGPGYVHLLELNSQENAFRELSSYRTWGGSKGPTWGPDGNLVIATDVGIVNYIKLQSLPLWKSILNIEYWDWRKRRNHVRYAKPQY